ncbi:MAG: hypothetical protein ABIT36_10165 [Steroidobacteraceae bacterium]
MHLTVVLADFFPDAAGLAASAEQLPDLPALATLLRYGQRVHVGDDWRGWLAQELGRPDLAVLPFARVASAALQEPAHRTVFATPVHLLAGIDHVRLHPAGLLRLDDAQSQQLAAAFIKVFGESGWRLAPLSGDLILHGLPHRDLQHAADRTSRDPGRWLGANIAPAIAQGGDTSSMRRATAEIEMWLHEHPLNRERARRGELAVNSLWLWGGEGHTGAGVDELRSVAADAPTILAQDAFVTGLCAASHLPAPRLPTRFADVATTSLAVLSAAARDPRDLPLLRIEQQWLQPALAALRTGEVTRLRLHANGLLVSLSAAGLRRFWRRRQPWWQSLFPG